ncbi:hypothetical protein ACFOVU_26655 [Nocardiopsis sediminis]|uniref:Type I restriction enzyme R protein N-terminal domain-containing protein n=1 Tax=Nocardiopsis sediminis TaxID=1778267 RepID=A0ABV8FXN4_9ACTN
MHRPGEFGGPEDGPAPWEAVARDRLSGAMRRFAGPLAELVQRGANEGDTRLLVTDFLSDALNYNKYGELTTEYRTKGESVDYGIVLEDELFALIEVKPVGQSLDNRNLRQAKLQAVSENVEWVILTNGSVWQVHHFPADESGASELIIDVDVLDDEARDTTVDALFHLSREAVQNGRLDDLRKWRAALGPAPLADALRSTRVVTAIRAELRRRTGHAGHVGDSDEIVRALADDVVARGLLDTAGGEG